MSSASSARRVLAVIVAAASVGLSCQSVSGPMGPELSLIVAGVEVGEDRRVLPDATVCETDTNNCTVTDIAGAAELTFFESGQVSVTVDAEGYSPHTLTITAPEEDEVISTLTMGSDELTALESAPLDYPWPNSDTGIIVLVVVTIADTAYTGATFSLVGSDEPPYYSVSDGAGGVVVTYDATETSGASRSAGGFVNVPTGQYEIEFGGNVSNCTATEFGWASDTPNRIVVPAKAGESTVSSVVCR